MLKVGIKGFIDELWYRFIGKIYIKVHSVWANISVLQPSCAQDCFCFWMIQVFCANAYLLATMCNKSHCNLNTINYFHCRYVSVVQPFLSAESHLNR